jgi:hypothetical protein
MAKKSDAAEIERRIEAVYRLILDGWDSTAIVQNSTSRGWGVKSRQIRGYIRRARTRMRAELEKYRLVALEEHVAARRKLRKETHDERVKLEVLRDEAKLLGLYAAERKEHSGPGGGPIETKTNVTGIDSGIAEIVALFDEARKRSGTGNPETDNQ